uniref:DAGKa domain-containing protein n=1 Tax=Caenorhabditis tropicalis TaxID=1561998 RepID=A0A1I7UH93_9PELO
MLIKKAKSFQRWTRCYSAEKRKKDQEITLEEDFSETIGRCLPFWQPPHSILELVINPRGAFKKEAEETHMIAAVTEKFNGFY